MDIRVRKPVSHPMSEIAAFVADVNHPGLKAEACGKALRKSEVDQTTHHTW